MRKILKTIRMLALLLALPVAVQAQTTIVVAEGTASPNVPPFYLYNAKYAQWSQSVYPASELTALVGQTLTAFTYHTSITTLTPDPGEWTIMLGITSNSDLAYGKDNTVCTTVFEGRPTFDMATGDMTFTFDTPYEYEGGNLLVWFDHQAGTTTEMTSCTWQAKSATNASRRAYNSSFSNQYTTEGSLAAYLPTIKVTVQDAQPSDPAEEPDRMTVSLNNYIFAPTQENYVPLNQRGGTAWSTDEQTAGLATLELPFDFPFGTQTIAEGTALYISASKGLALTQSGHIFAPMSLTDQNAAYGGIGDSTIFTYVTSDSVVVEWNAVQHGTGTTGNTYTFQLVLEANGNIAFHYVNCTVNSSKEIVQGVYCSAAENTSLNGYSYADPSRNHAGLSTRSISSYSKPRDGQIYRFVRPDCAVVTVSGSTPWIEEFDDLWVDNRLPGACWESVQSHNGSSTNNHWNRSYNDHSGSSGYGAYMSGTYSMSGSWNAIDLITPLFDIPEAGAYTVGFWMKRGSGSTVNAQTGVRLFVSTTTDTADGQLLLFAPYFTTVAPTVAEAGWYYYEATVPTAGRQYFILRGVDYSNTRLDVDGIRVAAIPNCSHPANLAWDAGNQQVTWTAGSATQWQVRDGETYSVVNTPSYSNPAWLSATNYNVYVRSICGADDTLEWRGPVSFMTPCDIIALGGNDSLVYDFDNLTTSGTIPACWATSHISGPGSQLWGSYSAVSAHSGNRVMRLPDMSPTTITNLVTSQINIPAANSYEVRLWIKRGNGTKQNEGVKVWVNTTPDTIGGTPLFHARRCITVEPVVDEEGWYEYRGIIPMAGNLYVVLQGISEYGQETWIDDLAIAPATTTDEPEEPTDGIQYWVGTGANSATFTLHFNNAATPVSFVWGYRWDDPYGDYTVGMMMEEIAEADSRVSFDGLENGFINNYSYNDGTYNLSAPTGSNFAGFIVNDEVANAGCNAQALADGDAIAWMDADYDFFMGDINLGPTDTIYVTEPGGDTPGPQPVVRPFAAEDILYWVGTGDTGSVVVVSWDDEAGDEVALAWGVRYESDSYPTVLDLLDSIQEADSRFTYSLRRYMGEVYDINAISYEDDTYDLAQANTSNIHVRVWGEEQTDDVVGSELETFSVWDGDLVQISTSGMFTDVTVIPVTEPATPVEPVVDTLCSTVYTLPYATDFSGYVDNHAIRPHMSGAMLPDCWTVLNNGTRRYADVPDGTTSTYFGGIGYSTSTNSFGAIAADDAYMALVGSQIYTGDNAEYIAAVNAVGTRRYAVLPLFDHPLSQTVLSFDHRTSGTGARLVVGYILADTSSFVGIDTMAADNRVLHHDTVHFGQQVGMPADARLTFLWDVTSSTNSTTGPSYRYCGIDNLSVTLATADTTAPADTTVVTPADATIAYSDILYWVGNGSDSAIFVIMDGTNARAWGYRFDEDDNLSLDDMATDIADADPRLVYSTLPSYDMGYIYKEHPMLLSAAETNFKVNGVRADGTELLEDYDLEDGMVVVMSDLVTDPWNTTIVPASYMPMPVDATIAADDIEYWVGTGSNSAVIAINWGSPDTALAWGLRFDGAPTVANAVNALANADARLSVNDALAISNILYDDSLTNTHLQFQTSLSGNYLQFVLDGNGNAGWTSTLSDGSFLKIGESAFGVGYDSVEYYGTWYPSGVVWTTPVQPVNNPADTVAPPAPVEAVIAASDILFWVGTGANEVVMAVNWADTALAWGYRFDGSATVQNMMDDIAAVDPRFSYVGSGFISDILYIDTAAGMTDTLRITPGNYWSSTNNGVMDMGMSQTLSNGDFEKLADPAAGIVVDSSFYEGWGWSYTYVYPMTIHPVTVPDTTGNTPGPVEPEHGPFCGAVGTEGCNAIAADSSAIVAWATGVELTRGPQNIANPDGDLASFGTETNAVGMATMSNTMDAVSLGDGGSALVTFATPIRNGEGPDFAVFENGFGDNSLELAFVEVSSDGERFVRFPATCLTQTETQLGNAGATDPTNINNLAGKFKIGYGTPFDLDELRDSTGINIDSIVYVRIVDVVGSIDSQYASYDAYGHIVNDPWPTPFASSGFDLTGVAVLNEYVAPQPIGIEDADFAVESVWPNPTTDRVSVTASRHASAVLYDQAGRRLMTLTLQQGRNTIDLSSCAAGVYMLRAEGSVTKIVKR